MTFAWVECKGCVLCRSFSVTVLGRVCGRRRRRPRRGSLRAGRGDGVLSRRWRLVPHIRHRRDPTHTLIAPRWTPSTRDQTRQRDTWDAGETPRRASPSGGRRAKEAAGPLGTGRYASGTPPLVEGAHADGIDFALISAALDSLLCSRAAPRTQDLGEATSSAVALATSLRARARARGSPLFST